MICGTCHGSGRYWNELLGELSPCPDCIGGIASCCDAAGSYQDGSFPERECDRCGKPYRGPAVYCSLECAVADA